MEIAIYSSKSRVFKYNEYSGTIGRVVVKSLGWYFYKSGKIFAYNSGLLAFASSIICFLCSGVGWNT